MSLDLSRHAVLLVAKRKQPAPGDPPYRTATGCAVAADAEGALVLTTRHALFDGAPATYAAYVAHRRVELDDQPVVWSSAEHDLVLVRCRAACEPPRIGPIPLGDAEPPQFRAAGFPEAGVQPDASRALVELAGQLYPGDRRSVQIGVNHPVSDIHDWAGASGSPVFVGNVLVGVIREVPAAFSAGRINIIALDHVVRSEPPGPAQRRLIDWIGRLEPAVLSVDVPRLPVGYVRRDAERERVVGALVDAPRRPSSDEVIVVHGMAGAGKTQFAAEIIGDPRIQTEFSDAILYSEMGRDGQPFARLAQIKDELALRVPQLLDVKHARSVVGDALKDRRALLVIDDVWRREHFEAMNVVGPHGRVVVTTRNADVVPPDRRIVVEIGPLDPDGARRVLAARAGLALADLPPQAADVLAQCGGLPLMLRMIGGLLRADPRSAARWSAVRARLSDGKLASIDQQLERALAVSLDDLTIDGDPRRLDAYLALSVLPEDAHVSREALAVLWSDLGADSLDQMRWLEDYVVRSLLFQDAHGKYYLHDLQYDLIRSRKARELPALHAAFVAAYRRARPVWLEPSDDGYFFANLANHLSEAGLVRELDGLVDRAWMEARYRAAGRDYRGFLADLAIVQRHAQRTGDAAQCARIQTARQVVRELAGVDDASLEAMVYLERRGEAERIAELEEWGVGRFRALAAVASAAISRHEPVDRLLDSLRELHQRLDAWETGPQFLRIMLLAGRIDDLAPLRDTVLRALESEQTDELVAILFARSPALVEEVIAALDEPAHTRAFASLAVAMERAARGTGLVRLEAKRRSLAPGAAHPQRAALAEALIQLGRLDEAAAWLVDPEAVAPWQIQSVLARIAILSGEDGAAAISPHLTFHPLRKRVAACRAARTTGDHAHLLELPAGDRERAIRVLLEAEALHLAADAALHGEVRVAVLGEVARALARREHPRATEVLDAAFRAMTDTRREDVGVMCEVLEPLIARLVARAESHGRGRALFELARSWLDAARDPGARITGAHALARAIAATDRAACDALLDAVIGWVGERTDDGRWTALDAVVDTLTALGRIGDAVALVGGLAAHPIDETGHARRRGKALRAIARGYLAGDRAELARQAIDAIATPTVRHRALADLAVRWIAARELDPAIEILRDAELIVVDLRRVAAAIARSPDRVALVSGIVDRLDPELRAPLLVELACEPQLPSGEVYEIIQRVLADRRRLSGTTRDSITARSANALARVDPRAARDLANTLADPARRAATLGWIAAELRDPEIVAEAMAAFRTSVAALTDRRPRRGQNNHRYRRFASYLLSLGREDLVREMVDTVDSRARHGIEILRLRQLAASGRFDEANEIASAARIDSFNTDPSRSVAANLVAHHPFEAVRLLRPTSLGDLLRTLSQWLAQSDDPGLESMLVSAIGVAAWTHPEWREVQDELR